jgi:TRAP-type C4-dicarboxylate transport system permease small subunit
MSGHFPFLNSYYRWLQYALTLLMLALIGVVTLQITSRFTGILPQFLWTEEAARFCFVWIIMLGSAIAVRDGAHFDVDLIPRPKTNRTAGSLRFLTHLAMIALAFLFVRYGWEFAILGFAQRSEISAISMLSVYISFPVAGMSWVAFLLEHLWHDLDMITNQQTEGEE